MKVMVIAMVMVMMTVMFKESTKYHFSNKRSCNALVLAVTYTFEITRGTIYKTFYRIEV